MNKLPGTIKNIQHSGSIMLVDVEVNAHLFSAMLIEASGSSEWLSEGNRVNLIFKETEVSLAKNLSGLISLRNRMKCTVRRVERGQLLSKINLNFQDYELSSAITTRSADALNLAPGDEVEALVKANEVSLMKSENRRSDQSQ